MIFQSGVHLKTGKCLLTDREHVTLEAAQEAVARVNKDLRDKKAVFHLIVNGSTVLVPQPNVDYVEFSVYEMEEE